MNDPDEVETRGSPYAYPKARRGIHEPGNFESLDNKDMGKYGDVSDSDDEFTGSSPNQVQGTDEVDNVMSKIAQPSSPQSIRRKKDRRNSLNGPDEMSNSNTLAKSLPANLPSYYCSNDSLHQLQHRELSESRNTYSESRTEGNRNNSHTTAASSSPPPKRYSDRHHSSAQTGKSCQNILITIIVAIIGLAAYGYKDFSNLAQGTSSIYDEIKFNKDINNLGDKYKINENSLLEVQSGISTILRRNDSGSFIFVYNGESEKFNYLRFSNFMQDIASAAARYLRNDTVYNRPTVLHSSELDMQNHSELMNKYRHEVAKTGVLLVKDVDRVPANLAMAFHYFCDEYNPLVAKSAIFFTLNFANCSDFPSHKSTHNNVEKCLANIWNSMPKDNIKPLLARVVNVVIDVTNVL